MKRLLIALVIVAAPAWSAVGEPASLEEVVKALEKSAGELWPSTPPKALSVKRTKVYERFSEGVRFETWAVTDGTTAVGDLIRYQVFKDPAIVVDLALRVADKKIAGVSAVKPLVFAGKPFAGAAALFAALKDREVGSYAGGMGDMFQGLAHLDAGAAGEPPPPPPPPPGAKPVVQVFQPTLAANAPIPAFAGTTISGAAVSSASLVGKPLVILVGDAGAGRSRDMMEVAMKDLKGDPKVRALVILANDRAALGTLLGDNNGADVWLPDAILDADGKIQKALLVTVVPQIFLFDKKGKLVGRPLWTGIADLRAAITAAAAR